MDKAEISGIGEHFKQFTTLPPGLMLDEEANYRLFSAMTHGHLWATSQLGFRINAVGAGSPLAVSDALPKERGMPALAPAYLCLIASKTLVTFMGYQARIAFNMGNPSKTRAFCKKPWPNYGRRSQIAKNLGKSAIFCMLRGLAIRPYFLAGTSGG